MIRLRTFIAAAIAVPFCLATASASPQAPLELGDWAFITRVEGMKSAFRPGERVTLSITAKEKTGDIASPQRGWNLQYLTYLGPVPSPRVNLVAVQPTGSFGGNATYINGVWTLSFTLPSAPGGYFIGLSLYCASPSGFCSTNAYSQDDRDLSFRIDSSASQSPSTLTFTHTAPATTCTDTDGGVDLRTAGTVTVTGDPDEVNPLKDQCSVNTLYEYSCSGQRPVMTRIDCPNGCQAGTCVSVTENRPPVFKAVWAVIDPLNSGAEHIGYNLFIDVRKGGGTPMSVKDFDDGVVSLSFSNWFSETRKYSSPGQLGYRTDDKGQPYFSIAIGENRSDFPLTEKYLLVARQGKKSVRKVITLSFDRTGKVKVRLQGSR